MIVWLLNQAELVAMMFEFTKEETAEIEVNRCEPQSVTDQWCL